ncbi:bacterial regulatory helix-turn-helix s, AraC family protein [Acinetobacter sp. 742879]|uniref:AraC family transcriptional regulator n=1 Tax=Acinetobacter TaxID=469 RepID=UPI0004457CD1|nr:MULTISPECIES: AraC family transcriptional regulator [Acinetobacter calcoaceticus/baumannii complex]EXS30772.1 bacterial regulatory helix-turn-helix s, AraC family protein [Acinetobacter sp. 742879]MDX8162068.1 AraC family transcriptional regulator [Acinetobacter pittii]
MTETIRKVGPFRNKFFVHHTEIFKTIQWMGKINGPHQLDVPSPKHMDFSHEGLSLGDITFGQVSYSTEVQVKLDDLQKSYIFNIPIQGQQTLKIGNLNIESNTEIATLLSPHLPLVMTVNEGCKKQVIRISKKLVEEHLIRLLGYKLQRPLVFDVQAPLQGQIKQWFQLAMNLQEMVNDDHSLCDSSGVWNNFESNLVIMLLNAQPHNYSQELKLRQQGRPTYLSKVEQVLTDCLDQPLNLRELEKILGVSRERLYRDFHLYFGQSPIAYFRDLRFEAVHKRLQQIRPWENVSSIALDCGFQQLGRFSNEYKRKFGELPSETLLRFKHIN